MTGAKPSRPAVGQRWRFDGRERAREFEAVEIIGRSPDTRVRLRNVDGGDGRVVEWHRLRAAYVYLGDFSVPEGYSVHKIEMGPGGHCYRTPAGNVIGGTQMDPWTWKRARDEAAEHAATNSTSGWKKA